jgi:hypothetical protein
MASGSRTRGKTLWLLSPTLAARSDSYPDEVFQGTATTLPFQIAGTPERAVESLAESLERLGCWPWDSCWSDTLTGDGYGSSEK